ncbi:AraC-like DNA-binding protein [Hephaestia caeni]|uniref:AraC-like DNA-binding protein n=2 Tax=Hephaestia caeni TaxID=645617 RepID=A0A397PEG1_9SPHN|nr:AraC-like DNA-binding protein [Hephaestia caeni]
MLMAHDALPAGDQAFIEDRFGDVPGSDANSAVGRRRSRKGAKLAQWQLKKAQELMFEQLTGALQVIEIAQGLGMSTMHFTKAFKNTVGIPPYGWHLRQRIARSASLLHDDALTLAQIAAECGFSDQSHYTKAFRRLLGITPGKWRRTLKTGSLRGDEIIRLNPVR